MSAAPLTVGVIAFACVFGGALLGMLLQRRVPAQRLSPDTKDVVKLGMGLVGTMALALACCSIGPWPTKGPRRGRLATCSGPRSPTLSTSFGLARAGTSGYQ
jgi:hypothetical protein